jgi:hypothetical protein
MTAACPVSERHPAGRPTESPASGRRPYSEEYTVPISVNLDKGLDKAYENASIDELLKAPPSALAGLTERHDEVLAEVFNIKTLADLGSNKYFALAGALVALSTKTG